MNQQIYWHAPIWEVALIVFTGFLIVCWMIYRIFSPKQLYRALRTVHPLLDTQPLFFYTKIQGLYFLNSSSRDLLDLLSEEQHRQTDFLVDIMSESITENRPIQEMGWLRKDQVLIAIPFVGEDEIGALVTVIRIDEGTELNVDTHKQNIANNRLESFPEAKLYQPDFGENWLTLGPYLRIHSTLPIIYVKRSDTNLESANSIWVEEELTHFQDKLLRYFLQNLNETQTSESIFKIIWPDDKVDRVGLRPDQKDRLRRLIFQLRQSIEPYPRNPVYLHTAHGVGYTLYENPL